MTSATMINLETYDLTLLQFRPDASSEEIFNIGVVAYNPETRQLLSRITRRIKRFRDAYPDLQRSQFTAIARALTSRCNEVAKEIDDDRLGMFRDREFQHILDRIVAPGSVNFGWGNIRTGVCDDLQRQVDEMFLRYVEPSTGNDRRERITNEDLWSEVVSVPEVREAIRRIGAAKTLASDRLNHTFKGHWLNGVLNVVDSISLDYAAAEDIEKEATSWYGRVVLLGGTTSYRLVAFVTDPPADERMPEYQEAVEILRSADYVRDVIPSSEASRFADIVDEDLARAH